MVGCRGGTASGLQPIHEVRAGFRLLLDPAELTADDVNDARDSLRRALRALDPGGADVLAGDRTGTA